MKHFVVIIIVCVLMSAFAVAVSADGETEDFGYSELEEYIPDDILDDIPEGLLSGDADAEDLSAGYIFDKIIEYAKGTLFPSASLLSTLLGLTIISSSFELFSSEISDGKMKKCVSEVVVLLAASRVFTFELEIMESVTALITVMTTFSSAAAPVLASTELAAGNVSGAAVTSYGLFFFSSALELITSFVFVPLCRACLALAVVSAVSFSGGAGDGIGSVCGLIKRTFTSLLSAAAMIFSAVICCQTSLSSSSDTLASRGIKFAVGSSIPIVGGALGDAITTTAAGISIIKSHAGTLGIVVLILTSAPVIINLFANSAVMGIAAVAANLLGAPRLASFYGEIKEISGLALAMTALSVTVFIIVLALYMNVSPAIAA
ncbi:MAG: stage III sporulation protein AE [Firmicutes bacterium]|nr:stage III sporulation protein AE [Bacillota bacterium]